DCGALQNGDVDSAPLPKDPCACSRRNHDRYKDAPMSYVKARDDRERSSSRRYEDPAAGAVDRIWRHHPQAMRDWYNILVDATVDEVNAKTADAFYKAGTSIYSIKTVVSPYGLPRNFIVALYSPRDETLVVGSP